MGFVYEDHIFNNARLNSQVLNGIADLVRVLNANNEVIFVNRTMEEALLCRQGNQENLVLDSSISKRTIETGEIIQREEVLCGSYFSVKCSPIFGEENEIVGAVEVYRNISMQRELQREIVEKNKEMTFEMESARKIQQSLLPEKGFFSNISIDYVYKPSNVLSGDMFDIFKINEDNIGIYIADSVGHGFASSMITMFIRIIVRNISSYKLLSPARTLNEVARKFANLNLDIELYFTCFYGVYNKKLSKFTYTNAGHYPCPLLFQNENVIELETSGYPIARYFKDVRYKDESVKMESFDKILLMTDGITDARNTKKEVFGIDKVKETIKKNSIDELKILEEKIDSFIKGKQRDDITALLLKVW